MSRMKDHYENVITVKQRHQFLGLVNRCRNLRDVTRLWNWADAQIDCEQFFDLLWYFPPWAFVAPTDTNSIHFTY